MTLVNPSYYDRINTAYDLNATDKNQQVKQTTKFKVVTRSLAYAWAFPTTCVGLIAGGLTLASGGRVQRKTGALEFHGGFARWLLEHRMVRASAMTLGHVILGRDPHCLDSCRDHEQVHVRQVERWGIFFLPAYFVASGWAYARRKHYYLDNWFELDARRRSDDLGTEKSATTQK